MNVMNIEHKEQLTRFQDTSGRAISVRLVAARHAAGFPQQKAFAEALGLKQTTYNTQEIKGSPSFEVMRYLARNHRIDFNFIIHGDFVQLPSDVQTALFAALPSPD